MTPFDKELWREIAMGFIKSSLVKTESTTFVVSTATVPAAFLDAIYLDGAQGLFAFLLIVRCEESRSLEDNPNTTGHQSNQRVFLTLWTLLQPNAGHVEAFQFVAASAALVFKSRH